MEEFQFNVVDIQSAYNAILGTPAEASFNMVVSVPHQRIKFLTTTGVEIMTNSPRSMYDYLMKKRRLTLEHVGTSSTEVKMVGECSNVEKQPKTEYEELNINSTYPEQKVKIGVDLSFEFHQALSEFLISHQDNFAWTTKDMPGLGRTVADHKLNVDPTFIPVQQRSRQFKEDMEKVMKEEIRKLLDAQFIEEVSYPTWLANVFMVKKENGK